MPISLCSYGLYLWNRRKLDHSSSRVLQSRFTARKSHRNAPRWRNISVWWEILFAWY